MNWLPRISFQRWCDLADDGEVEGFAIRIAWGRFEAEIAFGRHNGRFR